ncbi:Hypothetical predicted protein [Octopus vulgaris]|uniref:Uncharacterized protein n=1 Tax=Octopus vulgaris TaxID=6645 RepID=A0AA36ANT2_OCTVU|nr:Hypothetical predicted protein [Octopus vulgaris]
MLAWCFLNTQLRRQKSLLQKSVPISRLKCSTASISEKSICCGDGKLIPVAVDRLHLQGCNLILVCNVTAANETLGEVWVSFYEDVYKKIRWASYKSFLINVIPTSQLRRIK